MEIFRNNSGIEQCKRCNFMGEMREGSIDEINSARKKIMITRSQSAAETKPSQSANPLITNKELNQRLEKLKEKKPEGFEEI
jgi:hypothetical protein